MVGIAVLQLNNQVGIHTEGAPRFCARS